MRTPMNILLDKIEFGHFMSGDPKVIGEFIKYNLLEKEKEQIINAFVSGEHQQGFESEAEQYYKETYEC